MGEVIEMGRIAAFVTIENPSAPEMRIECDALVEAAGDSWFNCSK